MTPRIATGYELHGPGLEHRWRRDFPEPSRPAPKPTELPVQWAPGLFPGVKRAGCCVDQPPHLAEGSSMGRATHLPAWRVTGQTLSFSPPHNSNKNVLRVSVLKEKNKPLSSDYFEHQTRQTVYV